jgi:hypothetical protein
MHPLVMISPTLVPDGMSQSYKAPSAPQDTSFKSLWVQTSDLTCQPRLQICSHVSVTTFWKWLATNWMADIEVLVVGVQNCFQLISLEVTQLQW